MLNYSIAQESRIGGREVNQDRVASLATDESLLMVVADGMGGHLQGEVAAQLAIDVMVDRFRAEAKPRLANPAGFLGSTLRHAHQTIVRYAAECGMPAHAAPRTTCIACVVQDGQACWAHAGDSRLYLIHERPPGPARVSRTRDHSVVQRLVDEGSISNAQAAGHPQRNRVFSCLGGDVAPQVEVSAAIALDAGDVIALCTDGAWSPLGDRLVNGLSDPLTMSVPRLLDAAERAAGPRADNLTLIALRWEAPAAPARDYAEEVGRAIAEIRRRHPLNPNEGRS